MFVDLAPSESKWVRFDSSLLFDFVGPSLSRVVSFLPEDNERSNDSILKPFTVSFVSDVKASGKSAFAIYPNPTTGLVYIQTLINSHHSITLWNISGQKVYGVDLKPTGGLIGLDLRNESKITGGVYFLRIQNTNTGSLFKLVVY